MDQKIYGKGRALRGELTVPGDKSISHRALMLSALTEGETRIRGFLYGADCISTIRCLREMGISIESREGESGPELLLRGVGLRGLRAPERILDCGNSGTTMRLLSGLLSAQRFDSVLSGDESIRRRPMGRVIRPLTEMGADIFSERGDGRAPLHIHGRALRGISYESPLASAQVKSAILLAGLYAEGESRVIEPELSRDHSERMLRSLGVPIESRTLSDGRTEIRLSPVERLASLPDPLFIPGDISSAAYFLTAALIVPGSELLLRNVGTNPTRDGILEVYRSMGGDISSERSRIIAGEEVSDLRVRHSKLHGTTISGALIPRLIDELPVIAVAAAAAEGETLIKDAADLRQKESDRISAVAEGLRALGVSVEEREDGMRILGQGEKLSLREAEIDSRGDHRIAMSFAVLGLLEEPGSFLRIHGSDCIGISYPDFFSDFEKIC